MYDKDGSFLERGFILKAKHAVFCSVDFRTAFSYDDTNEIIYCKRDIRRHRTQPISMKNANYVVTNSKFKRSMLVCYVPIC